MLSPVLDVLVVHLLVEEGGFELHALHLMFAPKGDGAHAVDEGGRGG